MGELTEIDYGQLAYVVEEALFRRKDKHLGFNAFCHLMSNRSELMEQNASLQQRVEGLERVRDILVDGIVQARMDNGKHWDEFLGHSLAAAEEQER